GSVSCPIRAEGYQFNPGGWVTGCIGEERPMPWHETCAMDERMAFVTDWRRDELSFSALCRQYGVSRKAGYKWIGRYEAEGVDGLKERSHAVQRHPNAVEAAVVDAVVAVRMRHPLWGPK